MKKTIKNILRTRLLTLFMLLLCATATTYAGPTLRADPHHECPQQKKQDDKCRRKKFGPNDFIRDLSAFISREAGFTEAESRSFFPVYFEMKEKMRNIEHQKGRSLQQAADKNMSERDCRRVLRETEQFDKKQLRIETQYKERLCKIVGARKLVKAIDADRRFGRDTFKQMTKREKK